MLPINNCCMNINTEEIQVLRKKFRDYISASVTSQECHDDIGVMVYPVVRDKHMGQQFPVKTVIEEIRQDAEYLKNKPKSELPAIFFSVSGFTGSKESQNVTQHTGLIVIDIDKKDNPNADFSQLRKEFSWDKYVYACFRSPNGGVKAVFNTNLRTKEHHKVYFHSISNYVLVKYSAITKIDSSGSNINRACYMPYDADAYSNPYSYRYCLDDQQIAKISDEIKHSTNKSNSLKVILQVDSYSFNEHYDNILNLLKISTSFGLQIDEKRTSMGMGENLDSNLTDNLIDENRTSVGLYDNLFNNYRFNNIQEYKLSTDVPFFEIILRKHSYSYKLDYTTHLDEHFFQNNTQEPLSTDNTKGFEELDGLDYCEVIKPTQGIGVGFRHKTIASMSMKFIFNNPFCHPQILVKHLQYINNTYCLDPQPNNNPKPSDEEVQNIVLYNYQKFITGELDFSKVIRKNDKTRVVMKKYVFFSRKYVDICKSYTHLKAHRCFTIGRRDKNIRKYQEAIQMLQDGKKITQKRIAEYLGMSARNLRRYMTEENMEFFKLHEDLIKKYNVALKMEK